MRGDEIREKRQQSLVNAPYTCKKVTYLTRFHQVDKGNMIEAYVRGKQGSKKHGCPNSLSGSSI